GDEIPQLYFFGLDATEGQRFPIRAEPDRIGDLTGKHTLLELCHVKKNHAYIACASQKTRVGTKLQPIDFFDRRGKCLPNLFAREVPNQDAVGAVAVGAPGQELAIGADGDMAQLLALPTVPLGGRTVREVPDRHIRRIPGRGQELSTVWGNGEGMNG